MFCVEKMRAEVDALREIGGELGRFFDKELSGETNIVKDKEEFMLIGVQLHAMKQCIETLESRIRLELKKKI